MYYEGSLPAMLIKVEFKIPIPKPIAYQNISALTND